MIAASFGGLLKDFRIRKGLSQQDIAYAMGWSEPSRLSRIEQGVTKKPSRELVDRLMTVLRLNRNEKGQLLLSGGYLPTEEEIELIRGEVSTSITSWPYPAYLLDFTWRLLDWNRYTEHVYGFPQESIQQIRIEHPSSLEFVFSPDFPQNKYLKNKREIEKWRELLLEKLVRFRINNRSQTSEKWYHDFLNRMMKNEIFVMMWQKAQLESEEKGIANYEHKVLVNPENVDKRFNFHILRSPLLQDVRFEINYHVAGDGETMRHFSSRT